MYRLVSASHVGIVHQVVVQQRVVVVGLQSDGRHQDALWVLFPQVIPHERQDGADALSANRQHILYGFVQRLGFSLVGQLGQEVVDQLQDFT